jgi:hypothetical protein
VRRRSARDLLEGRAVRRARTSDGRTANGPLARAVAFEVAGSRSRLNHGLKLYGPSQEQLPTPLMGAHTIARGPAWKWVNFPVPPENVATP